MNFAAVNSLLSSPASLDPQSSQVGRPVTNHTAMWADLPTYFRQAAKPLRQWLQNPDVIEIACNRPGGVWIEARGTNGMIWHEVPELTALSIENLAQSVAGETSQNVNAQKPLLSAAMPGGERFQAVLAPVASDGGAFAIRKQVITDMSLDQYMALGGLDQVRVTGARPSPVAVAQMDIDELADRGAFDHTRSDGVIPGDRIARGGRRGNIILDDLTDTERELVDLLGDATPQGRANFLRFAVQSRITLAISGGTQSGKTTFANGLLKEIPFAERIISLEDTRELKPPHPNYLALVASRGGQGRANTTIQDCLEACLRLRPDRILMGEVRGAEAWSFLRAVNTGHPGSMTTLHADSPRGAYEALAMMVMQAGLGLTKTELSEYARFAVPLIVQIAKDPATGKRAVSEIYYSRFHEGG